MEKQVACDCGTTIRKGSDEELVAAVQQHAMDAHRMELSEEQVLAMAEVVPGRSGQ